MSKLLSNKPVTAIEAEQTNKSRVLAVAEECRLIVVPAQRHDLPSAISIIQLTRAGIRLHLMD